jgi:hypothetical protein
MKEIEKLESKLEILKINYNAVVHSNRRTQNAIENANTALRSIRFQLEYIKGLSEFLDRCFRRVAARWAEYIPEARAEIRTVQFRAYEARVVERVVEPSCLVGRLIPLFPATGVPALTVRSTNDLLQHLETAHNARLTQFSATKARGEIHRAKLLPFGLAMISRNGLDLDADKPTPHEVSARASLILGITILQQAG